MKNLDFEKEINMLCLNRLILILILSMLINSSAFSGNAIDSLQALLGKADRQDQFHILMKLAESYYINDEFRKSEESAFKALNIGKSTNTMDKSDAYNMMAYIYSYYQPEKVRQYCDSAFELSDKINYEKGKFTSRLIVSASIKNSEPLKSLEQLRRLQNENFKPDDKFILARSFSISGEIYRTIGNYYESIRNLLSAQKIFDELLTEKSDRFIRYQYGIVLNNLGITYKNLKNYNEALKYYNKYLALSISIDDIWGKASCYNNIGILMGMMDKSDDAIRYYEKASLEFNSLGSEKSNAEYNLSDTYMNMAIVLLSKSEDDKALELFSKSLKIFEKNHDSIGIAWNLANLSDYYVKHNQFSKAEKILVQSLLIAVSHNEINLQLDINSKLSLVCQKQNKSALALDYYKRYSELKDTLFSIEKIRETNALTANYENEIRITEEKRYAEIESQKTFRLHILEYFGITVLVVAIFIFLLQLPKFKVEETFVENMLFIAFLIAFQFLYALISPLQSSVSKDDPLLLFATNIVLALLFAGLNIYFEKKLRKRVIKKKAY